MHMADALLSPAVGLTMSAVSLGAVGYSIAKIKQDDLCEKKVPIMGVAGAFVFAAQMINFTIPATGSSGHIGGGILLAAMLGGFPSLLTLAAVLIIQALFFADGGLIALGCNIFNMGVIPCLLMYPLVWKPLIKKGLTYRRITAASIVSVVIGLQLGAFCVVLETLASGITELPFHSFLLLMQPIHLAIGIAEGTITAGVLCFVYRMRPELFESSSAGSRIPTGVSMKKVLVSLGVIALLTGGILSLFASSYPDGLEWSIEKAAGTAELTAKGEVFDSAAQIQEQTAFLPDYDYADGSGTGTSVSGIVGGVLTFALAGLTGLLISRSKKKKREATA